MTTHSGLLKSCVTFFRGFAFYEEGTTSSLYREGRRRARRSEGAAGLLPDPSCAGSHSRSACRPVSLHRPDGPCQGQALLRRHPSVPGRTHDRARLQRSPPFGTLALPSRMPAAHEEGRLMFIVFIGLMKTINRRSFLIYIDI